LFGSGEVFKANAFDLIMKESEVMPAMTHQSGKGKPTVYAEPSAIDSILGMVQL
jgi:hypothetical protein